MPSSYHGGNSVEPITGRADHEPRHHEGVSAIAVTLTAPPTTPPSTDPDATIRRRRAALRLALRLYARELRRRPLLTTLACVLPALGNICLHYLPPLAVAAVVGRLVGGRGPDRGLIAPYVVAFAAAMLAGQVCWRAGIHCLNRADAYGMEQLYIDGMDELLAKDAAFFHENFAGSLTKRVLTFASQYEDFVDTLAFQIVANLLPLAFASVVLWQFDPLLVLVLLGDDHGERTRGGAADPPPAGAGRRARGVVDAAVRPRRGHAEQHGRGPRLRLRAARGGRARAAGRGSTAG